MENKKFDKVVCSYLENSLIVESSSENQGEKNRFWHSDNRGVVAVILDNCKVDFLEYAEFAAKGIKRGHHYHDQYTEYLYVLSGEIKVVATLLSTREETTFIIRKGDLLTIKPNVAHGFISLERSEVLTMGSGSNPFNDRKSYSEFSDELYNV